jgi:hypothetical protein
VEFMRLTERTNLRVDMVVVVCCWCFFLGWKWCCVWGIYDVRLIGLWKERVLA